MRFTVFVFVLLFLFTACQDRYGDESAIASFDSKSLYFSDIEPSFPENMSEKDSLELLTKIVDNWLARQLFYEKALQHDVGNTQHVEMQVERFRQDIVIHEYKTKLLADKIDTVVVENQIQQYYDQHQKEFPLRENIAKYFFVKIPKSVPDAYRLNSWLLRANDADELIEIKEYSYQNARLYEFDDKWVSFEKVRELLPNTIDNEDAFLKKMSVHYQRDDLYFYFLIVNDYKLQGELAPMEYVVPEIKQIIKSKRKIEFINRLENNLINEAKNSKKVKINI